MNQPDRSIHDVRSQERPHWSPLAFAEALLAEKGVDEFDLCVRPFAGGRCMTIMLWHDGKRASVAHVISYESEAAAVANPWRTWILEAVDTLLAVRGSATCSRCGGDGYYKGPRLGDEPCPACEGTGKVGGKR